MNVICCWNIVIDNCMICEFVWFVVFVWLQVVWVVEIYKALHGMWFVVLNANFIHFYQLHPDPSPRPGKCYQYQKRRKIALCGRIALFYRHMIPYGIIFGIIEQKFENGRSKSIDQNWICRMLRITWYAFFGKPYLHIPVNTIYPHTVNLIYQTIHIIPTVITYHIT